PSPSRERARFLSLRLRSACFARNELRRKLRTAMRDVRHVGNEHLVGARVRRREVLGVFHDVLAYERKRLRLEPIALDDMQTAAVPQRRDEQTRLETDRVDDEHVPLPAAD